MLNYKVGVIIKLHFAGAKNNYGGLRFLIDYEMKALVIKCGLVEVQQKVSKAFYKDYLRHSGIEVKSSFRDIPIEQALEIKDNWLSTIEGFNMWCEASKVNGANYKRVKRLKNRVSSLLEKPCLFLTLTFRDEVLSNTNTDTRRQYVRRYLQQFGSYVGNIDYGNEHDREHYHAILQYDGKLDYHDWQNKCGNIDFQKVKNPNSVAMSKYISKLTNHAIKETTKGCRIIYSRV